MILPPNQIPKTHNSLPIRQWLYITLNEPAQKAFYWDDVLLSVCFCMFLSLIAGSWHVFYRLIPNELHEGDCSIATDWKNWTTAYRDDKERNRKWKMVIDTQTIAPWLRVFVLLLSFCIGTTPLKLASRLITILSLSKRFFLIGTERDETKYNKNLIKKKFLMDRRECDYYVPIHLSSKNMVHLDNLRESPPHYY